MDSHRLIRSRLGFTLFVATAVHAVALLAIGFTPAIAKPPTPSLEITLAQIESDTEILNADFLAQIDQEGNGTLEQVKRLSTDELLNKTQTGNNLGKQSSNLENTAGQMSDQKTDANEAENSQDAIEGINTFEVILTVASELSISQKAQSTTASITEEAHQLSEPEQIAILQAQIDLRKETMAKAPKKRILSALSTKSHQDAAYLEDWRRRIETVGNIHYPSAASEQKMYGSLRLLVAIKPDGSIHSIEILKSSGQRVLDDAAVKIVKLSAPFQPFTEKMRQNTDILEIIRTWKFEKTTQVY